MRSIVGMIIEVRTRRFLKKENITYDGYGGWSVDRFCVREFGYLLRYVTNGAFWYFDDQDAIHDNFNFITRSIQGELKKTLLREEEVFLVTHLTATGNLWRLQRVITAIYRYIKFKRRLEKRWYSWLC